MIFAVKMRRDVGRVTVERVIVNVRAPDKPTARIVASRFRGLRWTVETVAPGADPDGFEVTK